jgi:ribonuclease HII
MLFYERQLKAQGAKLIAGVDEAGRGPLAGPVVAGACILPDDFYIQGLNDSKQLSEEERERIFEEILASGSDTGVGIAEVGEIDRLNILKATFLAMHRALSQLQKKSCMILVDGHLAPSFGIPTIPIVKGDSLSASIAAASVLAKVTRDRIMKELSLQYPQYRFSQHKGYATPEHLAMLEKFGPCAIHRKSFEPVKSYFLASSETQMTLDLS